MLADPPPEAARAAAAAPASALSAPSWFSRKTYTFLKLIKFEKQFMSPISIFGRKTYTFLKLIKEVVSTFLLFI